MSLVFLTVGSQVPFDRLIKPVAKWSEENHVQVIAQVGKNGLKPSHIECYEELSPKNYNHYLHEANIVIGHAGMGTIISALKIHKPLIIMPRRAELGEHRNNHQLGTAREMDRYKDIHVAKTDDSVITLLNQWRNGLLTKTGLALAPFAALSLTQSIASAIIEQTP